MKEPVLELPFPRRVYKIVETNKARPFGQMVFVELGNATYGQFLSKLAPGDAGINFHYARSAYPAVANVQPGSPAELAGIKPGAKILSIDTKSCSTVGGDLLYKLLRGPIGTNLEILIEQDGSQKTLVLERVQTQKTSSTSRTKKAAVADYTIPIRGMPYFLREAAQDSAVLVEFYDGQPDTRIDSFIEQNADLNNDKMISVDFAGIGIFSSIKSAIDLRKLKVLRFDIRNEENKDSCDGLGIVEAPGYLFVVAPKEMLVDDLDIVRHKLSDSELLSRMKECVLFQGLDPPAKSVVSERRL